MSICLDTLSPVLVKSELKILIVEDEALVAADLEERLERLGYIVCGRADTCDEAIANAIALKPDLVLMDIHLIGEKDGIEAATFIRRSTSIPVVFLTAHADDITLSKIGVAEPFGYILKPFDERELKATLEVAFHRRLAESRIKKMERWLATTLGSIGDGVIATDLNGKIKFINNMAEQVTGRMRGSVLGLHISEVLVLDKEGVDVPVSGLLDEAFQNGAAIYLEEGHFLKRLDGCRIPVGDSISVIRDESGQINGWVIIFRDISAICAAQHERKKIEEKMQEAQRLESLGVLAGGIAHDFNNLLQVIVLNASLCEDVVRVLPGVEVETVTEMLASIQEASGQAANLCSQMLAYAGQGRFVVKDLELTTFIRSTINLLKVSLGKSVQLRLELAEDLPLIHADASQLQQIIMNLMINASDALGTARGTIRVETRLVQVTHEFLSHCRVGEELPEGSYVLLKVTDTGCGMSPETLAKIFDPFFSTKFKGRGLGLAAVMGIVRSHGGAMRVSSALGEGSSFEVVFPALKAPSTGTVTLPKPESAKKKSFGRVLLVDDEPSIRSAAKLMLRHLGFEVDLGVDGLEAIEKVRARGGNYRFVLMDMTMPNVSGHDAFKIIHEQYPSLGVILMSGYSDDFAKNIFKEDRPTAFLRKPFSPMDLSKLIPAE